jgi:hypothetical protein
MSIKRFNGLDPVGFTDLLRLENIVDDLLLDIPVFNQTRIDLRFNNKILEPKKTIFVRNL